MIRQGKLVSMLIVAILMISLTPLDSKWAVEVHSRPPAPQHLEASPVDSERVMQAQTPPEPLPRDCDALTPPGGDPPACCAYGYVYYDGVPVIGASVRIESHHGSRNITTASGGASSAPYYSTDLSSSPLLASSGDIITTTASYSGMVSTRTWVVQSDGQQVDVAVSAAAQWVGFTNANWVREVALEGNYLWAATSGGVLARNLSTGSYVKFTTVDGLADNNVYPVFVDGAGYRWFGTRSGLSVLDDGDTPLDKTDDTWTTFTTADGLVGNAVWEIVADGAGRKWFAAGGGVSVLNDNGTPFNKSDDQWQSFTTADGLACTSRGQALAIDSAGRKWIGCGWEGVSVLDDGGTPFNKGDDQWQSFGSADGLGSTLISSIAIDEAGCKWIGSWSSPGGVSVLNDNDTPFNKADDQWQTFFVADSGLVNNDVQSVIVDGAGYKWFGTNEGVSVLNDNGTPFNKSDDTWISFTTADGLAADRANDILIDGSGYKWFATEKWFGTGGGGVSKLNDHGTPFSKADDQWQTFATADGLANNHIPTILIDGAGRKWIGTYLGGANVLDDNGTPSNEADDQWQTFTATDGLPADIIYAIATDGSGRKWFGGHEYRVSVLDDNGTPFNKGDDQWQTFTTADGLAGITNDIVIDEAGRKWFGTWGGVSVLNDNGTPFNKTDDQWVTFTTADGLAHNFVGAIVIDGAGRKWIGTDGGVSVLNDNGTPFIKADDQWVTFTTADSLVYDIVGSIAIDRAGRKWFGTGIYTHSGGAGVSVLDDNGTPFNKSDDQWQSFTTADGLAGNCVQDIFVDELGRKWFETNLGVSVLDDNGTPFNKADDTWTTYTTVDGLTSNFVNCLVLDSAGNKWFGTEGGVSVLLQVQESPPTAAFTGSPLSGSAPLTVTFTDQSTGDITSWDWDFDSDGSVDSGARYPKYEYTAPETYTVSLTVTGPGGSDTETKTDYIVVNPGQGAAPAASFTVNPTSGNTTTMFNFDASGCSDTEDPVTALEVRWDWTDDGTYDTAWSTAKTITHTYAATGTHTIRLEVQDTDGMTDTTTHTVTVNPPPGEVTWAFLLYLDGDNNLYSWLERARHNLEAASANPHVTVLALLDGPGSGNTWRYHIQLGGQYTDGVNRWYLGELAMDDPQTLRDFITWARSNYPAQHYYLAVADHGRGTEGIAWDDTSGGNELITVAELRTALRDATNNGAAPLDVVHYDACLMAMVENAYQVKDYARYLVASENLGWSIFAYDRYAARVTASTTPAQLATAVVDEYDHALAGYPRTISALDLEQAGVVKDAVSTLATTLQTDLGANKDYVRNARDATQKFDSRNYFEITNDDEYLDLYDFARLIKLGVPDNNVKTVAQGVMDTVTAFVVAERHESGYYEDHSWNLDDAHGVAIYFPPAPGGWGYYDYVDDISFRFTGDGQWDEFLQAYYLLTNIPLEPPINPGVPPVLNKPYTVYLPIVLK